MKLLKFNSLFLTILTFCFFYNIAIAADEQFDIKTYYPVASPGSTYKEIILTPTTINPGCSGAVDEGKVYYNTTSKSVDVCVSNGTGGYESNPTPGQKTDYWYNSGNNIYNNNTGWVFLNKAVIGNGVAADVDFTINGIWGAYTDEEVYPLIHSASGTRWFGRYENYGYYAISTGAYNSNTGQYENFLINAVPDCCGFVGVGIRVPRAKLHVAYPAGGAVNRIFQVDTENTLVPGPTITGLAVDTSPYVYIGEPKDGIQGILTVSEEHFDSTGPALTIFGGSLNLDSAGEPSAGKVNMFWRQYIGFGIYYNGDTDNWVQKGDTANNGAAMIASNHLLGDLSFKVFARNSGATVNLNYPAYSNPNIYISNDGNVSINTTNSGGFKFYVNGTAGSGGDWLSPSDIKMKKNINTIDNALEKVNSLRGVSFEWKDSGFGRSGVLLGLIAQETEKIVPEVVFKQGDYYSMETSALVALLTEATKEQQKQIEGLKLKLKQLKNKINARI